MEIYFYQKVVKQFVEGAQDPNVLHSDLGGEQTDGGRRAQVEKEKKR